MCGVIGRRRCHRPQPVKSQNLHDVAAGADPRAFRANFKVSMTVCSRPGDCLALVVVAVAALGVFVVLFRPK
jgi:hypothetical protein